MACKYSIDVLFIGLILDRVEPYSFIVARSAGFRRFRGVVITAAPSVSFSVTLTGDKTSPFLCPWRNLTLFIPRCTYRQYTIRPFSRTGKESTRVGHTQPNIQGKLHPSPDTHHQATPSLTIVVVHNTCRFLTQVILPLYPFTLPRHTWLICQKTLFLNYSKLLRVIRWAVIKYALCKNYTYA